MDTKKLAKIIKLIVEAELKRQLPSLVKEGVQKVLNENRQVPVTKEVIEEEQDPFSLANAMLDEDRNTNNSQVENITNSVQEKKHFTKNSVLNEILNQTTPFSSAQRNPADTLSFGTNLAQGGTDAMTAVGNGQMGYKTPSEVPGTPKPEGGLGVSTGLPGLDRILNRDNSALVKKFKTRK